MGPVGFNPYAAAWKTAKAADGAATSAGVEDSPSGVTQGVSQFKSAMAEAEKVSMEAAVSGADPHAMVEAIANAELMLDAAVAIRNKVVEAYQELLRMPV